MVQAAGLEVLHHPTDRQEATYPCLHHLSLIDQNFSSFKMECHRSISTPLSSSHDSAFFTHALLGMKSSSEVAVSKESLPMNL
jgi:hypothetical protein